MQIVECGCIPQSRHLLYIYVYGVLRCIFKVACLWVLTLGGVVVASPSDGQLEGRCETYPRGEGGAFRLPLFSILKSLLMRPSLYDIIYYYSFVL